MKKFILIDLNFRKGKMFYLPIYVNDDRGTNILVSTKELEKKIEYIISITENIQIEENPSVFTTLTRPEWFKVNFNM